MFQIAWVPGRCACSVAGRPLAALGLRVVTPDAFERSIYLVDSCYRCEKENGAATIRAYPPLLDDICRLGPSFRVASRQAGVAGLCRLDICARARDPAGLSPRQTHEVLITDAAGSFAPAGLTVEEFHAVAGFELLVAGGTLGTLSADARVPVAFTSEGGFELAPEFEWTAGAQQELADRLGQLLENSGEAFA